MQPINLRQTFHLNQTLQKSEEQMKQYRATMADRDREKAEFEAEIDKLKATIKEGEQNLVEKMQKK